MSTSSGTSSSAPNPDASAGPPADQARALLLAKLFDLRTFIGALFLIFGVVVTIEGMVASQASIDKAAGVNLSLWTGIVMILVGAFFVSWMLLSPPDITVKKEDLGKGPGGPRGH